MRTLGEAWVVALLLMLGLASLKDTQPEVLVTGLFFICGSAGMWAVLRGRLMRGAFSRRCGQELLLAGALGIGMTLLSTAAQALGLLEAWQPVGLPSWAILVVLGSTGIGYLLCRGAAYAWVAWDHLRRTHMRWGLTHAHLSLVLLAAGAAALAILVLFPLSRSAAIAEAQSHGLGAYVIARFLLTFFPTLSLLAVLTVLALVVMLPPAALFSYFAVRRTTRRVEALTAATTALRAGHLGARVRVDGQDELAQLQRDFNAMAGTLQRTLDDLQTERDNVSTLLRARRELVAGVSHELRTPVATVRATLESLLSHWDERDPEEARHDCQVIENEVLRLQRLIDDLFTLSQAEVAKLSLDVGTIDAGLALQQMVDAMAPLAWHAGRVEVLADIPAGLPPALADAERLKQVMANLLRNGVRYTPPGGIVFVAARAEGNCVRIDVRDTGPGIAAEHLPHIWDRFYRGTVGATAMAHAASTAADDGLGLGLAIVKELTEAMGGTVAIDSTCEAGTCFTIRLPQA